MMALSDTQIEAMISRLPKIESLRELADEMGMAVATTRQAAAPYIALLRAQDALPPCECGKPRFHQYGCSKSGSRLAGQLKSVPAEDQAALMQRRMLFLSMLEAGERYRDIDVTMGATNGAARNYARHLTPAQRKNREEAIRAREENSHGR